VTRAAPVRRGTRGSQKPMSATLELWMPVEPVTRPNSPQV
jgi:hypothetical protein